jgi:hypothetical protein
MSLAEVLLAMAILSMFMLAIVAALIRGMDLSGRDEIVTQTTMYCNQIVESKSRMAADPLAYPAVQSSADDFLPGQKQFLYGVEVVSYPAKAGTVEMKRISVVIYYQDPSSAVTLPDKNKPNAGRIVKMSVVAAKPTTYGSSP